MDPAGDPGLRPAELGRVAEQVDGRAADRRQEHVEVGPGDQLREHAAGLLEQRAPQLGGSRRRSAGDAGQVPDRLDRHLGDPHVAGGGEDVAVGGKPPGATAAVISGMLMCARVMEIVGRTSSPAASSSANTSVIRWPPRVERDDRAGIATTAGTGRWRRPGGCWSGPAGARDRAARRRPPARDRPSRRRNGPRSRCGHRPIAASRPPGHGTSRPPRPRPPGAERPGCADATSARSARWRLFVRPRSEAAGRSIGVQARALPDQAETLGRE